VLQLKEVLRNGRDLLLQLGPGGHLVNIQGLFIAEDGHVHAEHVSNFDNLSTRSFYALKFNQHGNVHGFDGLGGPPDLVSAGRL
jgi:hypothetical protein